MPNLIRNKQLLQNKTGGVLQPLAFLRPSFSLFRNEGYTFSQTTMVSITLNSYLILYFIANILLNRNDITTNPHLQCYSSAAQFSRDHRKKLETLPKDATLQKQDGGRIPSSI